MTFNSQDLQAEKPPQKHSRPCSVVFCSQVWARTKPPSQLWVCSPGFIPLLLIILEIYPFSSTWPCCCPLCRAALSGELRAESHGCLQRAAQKPGGQLKVGKNKTDPKNDAWLVCKCWPGMRGEHPDSTVCNRQTVDVHGQGGTCPSCRCFLWVETGDVWLFDPAACQRAQVSLLCLLFLQELRSWAQSVPFLGAFPTPGCLNSPLTLHRCSQVGLQ